MQMHRRRVDRLDTDKLLRICGICFLELFTTLHQPCNVLIYSRLWWRVVCKKNLQRLALLRDISSIRKEATYNRKEATYDRKEATYDHKEALYGGLPNGVRKKKDKGQNNRWAAKTNEDRRHHRCTTISLSIWQTLHRNLLFVNVLRAWWRVSAIRSSIVIWAEWSQNRPLIT